MCVAGRDLMLMCVNNEPSNTTTNQPSNQLINQPINKLMTHSTTPANQSSYVLVCLLTMFFNGCG